MYTAKNFKTKRAVKDALARGERIRVYQPGPFEAAGPKDGEVCIEGPHYPEPHRWYATVLIKDGYLVKIK